jgi:hypothetical protein
MRGEVPFQGRVSGIYRISGALWQSVCDLEFRIDHAASFKHNGIKELNKTPAPPIYNVIEVINPHLFMLLSINEQRHIFIDKSEQLCLIQG